MLSYHLLTRALIDDASPASALQVAVAGVINGLVAHDTYVDVARQFEGRAPSDQTLSSRVGALVRFDLNPLMDLVRYCSDQAHFADCWNLVNTQLQLGVTTLVDGDRGEARRVHRRDEDSELRRRLVCLLIENVSPEGGRRSAADGPRRSLYDIACEVEQAGNIYADLIGYLHESPTADLDETIAALGCSRRTLQRLVQARGGGLTFTEIRQAVRICLSKELVRGSQQSFTEIAVNAGFYDAAHFCRAFHKSCGLSPSEYRRLSRHTFRASRPHAESVRQAA